MRQTSTRSVIRYASMKRGRTWRNRKRNFANEINECVPLNEFEQNYGRLKQWMKIKSNGLLKTCCLEPRDFKTTGRGLKATRSIHCGDVILSLPETLLITPATALESAVGDIIKRCRPHLTPQAALSLFLVYENHLGSSSEWFAYIQSVPAAFSIPLYFTPKELDHLPPDIREQARHMRERHKDVYEEVLVMLKTLPHSHTGWFTYDSFRWAWSVVNTRSVYLQTQQTPLLKFTPSGETNLALAPFLDLLNHSDSAQMEAGYNAKTKCYEIQTFDKFRKHDQVFISYGHHDNQKLFLEYGFTIPGNIYNYHQFSWNELCHLKSVFKIAHWEKKQSVISDNQLNQDLTCTASGLSWKLHNSLIILAMTWDELNTWRRLYTNGKISEANEKCVHNMAAWLINEAIAKYEHMKTQPIPNRLFMDILNLLQPCSEDNHDQLVLSLLQDQLDLLHKTLAALP